MWAILFSPQYIKCTVHVEPVESSTLGVSFIRERHLLGVFVDYIEFHANTKGKRAADIERHQNRWHYNEWFTHWSRVTYICVGNLAIIGSESGLFPCRRQAIIWTNAGILLKENALESVVWGMASNLSRPQCVKSLILVYFLPFIEIYGWAGTYSLDNQINNMASHFVSYKRFEFQSYVHWTFPLHYNHANYR